MPSSADGARVTMIDALVGNDYAVCLCSSLHAAGVNVELIVPDNRVVSMPVGFPIKYWMPTKDTSRGRIGKAFNYFGYLARLLTYLVRNNRRQRIVHFQFFRRERIESLLFPLLRLLGVNLIFTAHNVLPHENGRIDYLLRSIVYRAAKVIIVHSEFVKNKLATSFDISPQKIRVIPHGNFDHYIPRTMPSKAEARASLNLSDTDNVLLFFGYIREYKGLDLLLDALELSIKKGGSLKLVIAGAVHPPELEERYQRRINQIRGNESIVFHAGFVPSENVTTYFAACDAVVLPYRKIDHSGIVHLAYSFGRPLIATRVGDFPEVIEDGKSGYVLKENSLECLSETMLRAFSDGASLEAMGKYARELSETKYSWTDIAHQTKDLYVAR